VLYRPSVAPHTHPENSCVQVDRVTPMTNDPRGPIDVGLKRIQVERFASAYLLRTTASADQRQMSTRDKFSAAKTAAGRY
jgi:hypothetical protein